MKILSIETSCDETAVSIIEVSEPAKDTKDTNFAPDFKVLSNLVLSQVKLHEKYGGVFPNLAKREHSKNLAPLVHAALNEAGLVRNKKNHNEKNSLDFDLEKIKKDLAREPELCEALVTLLNEVDRPDIDLIAVTFGPGLEPALWVGINAAKVLGEVWGIPVMPINHMEGHISSVLLGLKVPVEFPAVALLISGGHTELVKVSDWLTYEVIGQTRDDAVGEAYDKVARMLGLPYPGGPQIGMLAEEARKEVEQKNVGEDKSHFENRFSFPRPMIKSPDFDFSFSGLKTSVLYAIKKIPTQDLSNPSTEVPQSLSLEIKKEIAVEFEDAIVETLVAKTKKAIEEYNPHSLIVAGGVIANKTIRKAFENLVSQFPNTTLLIPTQGLSTDNALMIALAAYMRHLKNPNAEYKPGEIKAEGNVQLS